MCIIQTQFSGWYLEHFLWNGLHVNDTGLIALIISKHLFEKTIWHSRLCREIGYTGINVNTLRPKQLCRHFADDSFKHTFLNENVWILIKISLKFVHKGPINNIPGLVQIMAWRRPSDKPLSEPILGSLLTHICITRPQWVKKFMWCDITSPTARE